VALQAQSEADGQAVARLVSGGNRSQATWSDRFHLPEESVPVTVELRLVSIVSIGIVTVSGTLRREAEAAPEGSERGPVAPALNPKPPSPKPPGQGSRRARSRETLEDAVPKRQMVFLTGGEDGPTGDETKAGEATPDPGGSPKGPREAPGEAPREASALTLCFPSDSSLPSLPSEEGGGEARLRLRDSKPWEYSHHAAGDRLTQRFPVSVAALPRPEGIARAGRISRSRWVLAMASQAEANKWPLNRPKIALKFPTEFLPGPPGRGRGREPL